MIVLFAAMPIIVVAIFMVGFMWPSSKAIL